MTRLSPLCQLDDRRRSGFADGVTPRRSLHDRLPLQQTRTLYMNMASTPAVSITVVPVLSIDSLSVFDSIMAARRAGRLHPPSLSYKCRSAVLARRVS